MPMSKFVRGSDSSESYTESGSSAPSDDETRIFRSAQRAGGSVLELAASEDRCDKNDSNGDDGNVFPLIRFFGGEKAVTGVPKPRFAGGDGSHECLAFVGDRALSLELARTAFRDCEGDADKGEGFMSAWSSVYARNDAMAQFVMAHAEPEPSHHEQASRSQFSYLRNLGERSDHTRATVFEAFLGHLFLASSANDTVTTTTHAYIAWVDANVELLDLEPQISCLLHVDAAEQTFSLQLGPHVSWSSADSSNVDRATSLDIAVAQESLRPALCQQFKQQRDALRQAHPARTRPTIVVPRSDSFETAQKHGSWQRVRIESDDLAPDVNPGQHSATELEGSRWTSRNNYDYTDFYWPCCGKSACSIRDWDRSVAGISPQSPCPRLKFSEPFCNAVHLGKLHDVGGGKKRGGGRARGGSQDHIPKGATPKWTCCGTLAGLLPGCSLNHQPLLEGKMVLKIELETVGSPRVEAIQEAIVECENSVLLRRPKLHRGVWQSYVVHGFLVQLPLPAPPLAEVEDFFATPQLTLLVTVTLKHGGDSSDIPLSLPPVSLKVNITMPSELERRLNPGTRSVSLRLAIQDAARLVAN